MTSVASDEIIKYFLILKSYNRSSHNLNPVLCIITCNIKIISHIIDVMSV